MTRYRHKKRGTEYTVIGEGRMQADDWVTNFGEDPSRNVDMVSVTIYQGDDDQIWVRPKEEFEDGRFERIDG